MVSELQRTPRNEEAAPGETGFGPVNGSLTKRVRRSFSSGRPACGPQQEAQEARGSRREKRGLRRRDSGCDEGHAHCV